LRVPAILPPCELHRSLPGGKKDTGGRTDGRNGFADRGLLDGLDDVLDDGFRVVVVGREGLLREGFAEAGLLEGPDDGREGFLVIGRIEGAEAAARVLI
jgi:hypothetical protein